MSFRLGRIFGIPVRIHYTLWILFLLIAWSLATLYMPKHYPGLSVATYWAIGVACATLLFVSVLIHELSHSIIAKRNGLPISKITLFFFGGVSEISEEPKDPWLEVRMAAAGPLMSFLIVAVLGGLWILSRFISAPIAVVATLGYSASLNAILGAFNLIPAFPLDGGRVLRGTLWQRTKDVLRATAQATTVSKAISTLMIIGGFLMIVFSDFINGLWIFFLGWFIRSGAENSLRQTLVTEALSGVSVGDIMTRDLMTVSPDMPIQQLVTDYFLSRPHGGYPVASNGKPVGVITMSSVRSVPKDHREITTVKDAMVPYEKVITVAPSTSALDALHLIAKHGVGRLLVTQGDNLVGILTRGDLMKAIRNRRELG